MRKQIINAVLCGSALIASVLMLGGCGRTEIDAGKYVKIEYRGYDNYGTADAHIDFNKMIKDNAEAFGLEKHNEIDELAVNMDLEENLKGSLDKTDSLKNGDTVTFKWEKTDTEELEKDYKIKLSFTDKSETVSGLEAPEEYDPFAGVSLRYDGFDGKGNVYFDRRGDGEVSLKLDDSANGTLKNGDKVKVSVNGNADEIAENLLSRGKKLTATEKEFTVDGLTAYKDVDPFEYLTVNFTGTSPMAEIAVKQNDDSPIRYIEYDISKQNGIKNGDTVKITVTGNYEDQGIKLSATEKEYTCEGLPFYAAAIEDLNDDVINKMKANNEDIIDAFAASEWKDKMLKKKNFRGCYFITPKEGVDSDWGMVENRMYFVYKISTNSKEVGDFYWCTAYSNIMVLEDGTISYDKSEATINSICPYAYDDGMEYYGYKDLDTLFNKVITAQIDKYQYQSTVEE